MTLKRDTHCDTQRAPKCHRPWTGFEVFDHLGDVRPCCWGKVSCGNVNEKTPEEIWNGPGFAFYRERMEAGDVDSICRKECPILQGEYEEQATQIPALPVIQQPIYLRVVPSTKCNLRCPMCYQLSDPPPKLPENFRNAFDAWLPGATELLVLGGEPFLARECLDWIEKVSPENYPSCGLAAITNGLAFTAPVLHLIETRSWNWMLVSIDAASSSVYRKVRGGEFALLRTGLERLAEARARSPRTWELRFGFTLQNDNLNDALAFLDLCEYYRARPQFTEVFGTWHRQGPATTRDWRRHMACLEALDKELERRGFSAKLVAGALARLQDAEPRSAAFRAIAPPTKFVKSEDRSMADGAPSNALEVVVDSGHVIVEACIRAGDSGQASMRSAIALLTVSKSDAPIASDGNVIFKLNARSYAAWARWREMLTNATPRDWWFYLPFMDEGVAQGALAWRSASNEVLNFFQARNWRLRGGIANVCELGLDVRDQRATPTFTVDKRRSRATKLSIIAAACDISDVVGRFFDSLDQIARDCEHLQVELIFVDDGSTDSTGTIAVERCDKLGERMDVLFISLGRHRPYTPHTFSFRAGLARQIAAEYSRGDVLLFLDPDQRVDPECVAAHLHWQMLGIGVVIGDRTYDEEQVAPRREHWQRLRTNALNGQDHWWLSFYTGNASVSRRLFELAGGFDPALQYWGLDDTDLGYRLSRLGARHWHTTRSRVVHPFQASSAQEDATFIAAQRLHMEVLYRKYAEDSILDAYQFCWKSTAHGNAK